MIFKNRRVFTKNLSPKKAWDVFADMEEERFIAFMRPITNIKEMCRVYASELPMVFDYEKILFTQRQIKEIEGLLYDHLSNFVENKGGYDKLDLMTEEEIEDYFDRTFEESLDYLAYYFKCSPEDIYRSIGKYDAD